MDKEREENSVKAGQTMQEIQLNMDITFKSWLSKVDKDTRKQAIESIFNILDAIKIEKVNDFSQ